MNPLWPTVTLAATLLVGARAADPDASAPFYVFRDGRPMAAIILPADALQATSNRLMFGYVPIPDDVPTDLVRAVEQFRRDLRQGFGVELPLGADSGMPNQIEIVVEKKPLLQEDETTVSFPKAHVMRIAGGESGVMRTLFHILEEFGGARYLFQGEYGDIGFGAHFPELATLSIPRKTFSRKSAFPLDRRSSQTTYLAQIPGEGNRRYWWNWEARLGTKQRLATGHDLSIIAFPLKAYQQSAIKPDEKIFPMHGGERILPWQWDPQFYQMQWQPRYSSPEAVDEAVRNILSFLREHPETVSLSLAVNDNGGHCETEIDPAYPVNHNPRLISAYYGWVNAVAERVTEEFQEVMFGVTAYREVESPPNFKLHPNVVVVMCFDLHACMDPAMRAKREKLIRDWAAVARIGSYAYNSGISYTLPRLYFRETQAMLQYYHAHGAVASFDEGRGYTTATEGPKAYVFYKLLEDPYLDLEAAILDWCRAAVGAEAATDLRRYYAFWEEFWRTKAVKTRWWGSRTAVYLTLSKFGSYMYGLEKGDMAHCRDLMEKMAALAEAHGTADQKTRARFLMKIFDWYEACAVACGAEYFAPDGSLPDSATALGLLRNIPRAQKACETYFDLPHATKSWLAPFITTGQVRGFGPVANSLSAVAGHLSDPAVIAELRAIAENLEIDPGLRLLADVMRKSATEGDAGNLLTNGAFETEEHGWAITHPTYGHVGRSDAVAAHGSHSLKCEIDHANYHIKMIVTNAAPYTSHYFSARVFIPNDQPVAEGRLNIRGSPTYRRSDGYNNLGHTANIQETVLTPGQWTYVSCMIPGSEKADSLRLVFALKNFERGDVVYIDDVLVHAVRKPGDE